MLFHTYYLFSFCSPTLGLLFPTSCRSRSTFCCADSGVAPAPQAVAWGHLRSQGSWSGVRTSVAMASPKTTDKIQFAYKAFVMVEHSWRYLGFVSGSKGKWKEMAACDYGGSRVGEKKEKERRSVLIWTTGWGQGWLSLMLCRRSRSMFQLFLGHFYISSLSRLWRQHKNGTLGEKLVNYSYLCSI